MLKTYQTVSKNEEHKSKTTVAREKKKETAEESLRKKRVGPGKKAGENGTKPRKEKV